MSLVRLLHGHSIDAALGVPLDDTRIFYMGHSLGGLMGAGFVPMEPDLKASVLNATGGGLANQLFLNSSIGAGAQSLVNGVLGLDPANPWDQFALPPNLVQSIIDPGDALNSARRILAPVLGGPRNVIQIEDWGDQVVPNQSNEALAAAAGLPIFDPYVQNLHQSPLVLPIANPGTPGTLFANAAGGLATAALVQNGPATHAASLGDVPGTLTYVPDFGHLDDFLLTGSAFPELERGVNVPNADMLDELLAWFNDVVASGPPGQFTFTGSPNFNPVENLEVPAGASTEIFFARTVDQGGASPASEPTADVRLDFSANVVATRVTAGRSILGTTDKASDRDVPPAPFITVGTPGVLPFFATLQRQLPGAFTADVRLFYTTDELERAGIPPDSAEETELVLATFVKLLNRWLTLGLLLGLIFLCASFVPAVFTAPFEVNVGGFHLSPFEALGLFLAGVVLVRQIPAHRLYFYRTPTNLPMGAFVVFTLFAGILAGDLGARLSDAAYFTASGFLLVFLIVSGEITEGFAARATRVIALAAVAVSLLGILEVVVQTHAAVGTGALGAADGVRRITGTLGNPVVLSAYLLLGMPLVLVELTCAERREERDFWLISTTLVIVGVVLTQTRTGLLALLVTGSVFCWRVSRRTFRGFAGATLAFVAAMVVVGGLRLSPGSLSAEFGRRLTVTSAAIATDPSPIDLLFGPEPGKGPVSVVEVGTPEGYRRERNANMHLTLMLRVGVVGWALMMWVIGSALLALYRGSRAMRDERFGLLLWAIFSSGLGLLVSMSNFNAFYNPTIQILFWGLLGIGMAIVTHRQGRRPGFNVIWRFGAED
jgi:hypothetical protein